MSILRVAAGVLLVAGAAIAAAGTDYGVADKRQVTFYEPVRVGDVLLPPGDYQLRHTVEGNDHVMVFTQDTRKKPAEARVKCALTPLPAAAPRTEVEMTINPAREQVLRRIVFRGDHAAHLF